MTDHIDPQFEIFSEMLDNEETLGESSVSVMGHDGAVLLDLRRHLRGQSSVPPLPEDFAKNTAQGVHERLAGLPAVVKGLVHLEPAMRSGPFSPAGLPWTFAGTLLGIGAVAVSWKAVVLLGMVTLIFGLSTRSLLQRYLPLHLDLPEVWREETGVKLSRLFYAIPVLSVLMTGLVGGILLARLGEVSLSFQSNSANLKLAGLAGALVVTAWLLNALWPVWRAYEEATRGRTLRTMFVQGLHALWMWVMVFAIMDSFDVVAALEFMKLGWWPEWLLLGFAGLAVSMTWVLSGRRANGPRRYSLLAAFRRLLAGFMVGAVPIVLTFAVFYQASLTRQLNVAVAPQYDEMTRYAEDWQASQKAIRPEDNGMTELEPILYSKKGAKEQTEEMRVAARLGGANELLDELNPEGLREKPEFQERMSKARRDFLKELPRIEAALEKPHFSYHATRELSHRTLVPNFILCRSISQALEGLTRESLDQGQVGQALHYQSVNLRWARAIGEGVLIDKMIGLALQRIALGSVERMLFEEELSASQLRELQKVLEQTCPQPLDFRNSMFLETYTMDRGLKEMAQGNYSMLSANSGEERMDTLLRLIPSSYWESERMTMLNLQLGQTANWTGLSPTMNQELLESLKLMPWSLTQGFIPSLERAECQFMLGLSRHYALRLEVALELYKRENGEYPEDLEALAPDYISEIPVDPMHPNLWKRKAGFDYQRTDDGYRLVSKSPLYDRVIQDTAQTYGTDGEYGFGI